MNQSTPLPNPGYHLTEIPKGELGTSSKILEEVLELIDAEKQECKIMTLIELSDLVGAISIYLERHASGISMNDLEKMSSITRRAFENGRRI
jgi:phosphoribosyl-ATP pyrophosphohydrolase